MATTDGKRQKDGIVIDLGSGCSIRHYGNLLFLKHPPGPQSTDIEREQGWCSCPVPLDVPENADRQGLKWKVESADPLTLSPSIVCSCGAHGWIREGRWVPA